MKNLNEKQQKIVNDLINEFQKLNKPTPKDFLIDVGEIKQKYNQQKNRKIEIEKANNYLSNIVSEVVKRDCETLNKSLKELGLYAELGKGFSSTIYIKSNKDLCYTYDLIIEVKRIKIDTEYLLNTHVNVYSSYNYRYNDVSFDKLEDVLNEHIFKQDLERLFNEHSRRS